MVELNEIQKKTIELLNPWHEGKRVELGIRREMYLGKIDEIFNHRKQIGFLLGSRRVGKTVILWQYIYLLIERGIDPQKILFLSLDNTNLAGLDLFGIMSEGGYEYMFLDEVHYFVNWAQILKSWYDLPQKTARVIATGSSSSAIFDNEAYLTGRSTNVQVYPLNYLEFSKFVQSKTLLNDYLYYGGYPENVLERNPNYLNELLRDVIEKDVAKIHNIRNRQNLLDVAQILAKQVSHVSSANKIAKVLGLDNKTTTNFIEYLREVQLVVPVYQYAKKLNERLYAPKKYYFQDLGMRNSLVGFVDVGAIVENAIYIKLIEKYGKENVFYGAGERQAEVDFVIKTEKGVELVESKYINLREGVINKLSTLMWSKKWEENIERRVVVTDGVSGVEDQNGVRVELVPLQQFLLG